MFCDEHTHLSRVERSDVLPLHDEHVNEVDEDAGGLAGVSCAVRQPLVENHEDQVAKETEQEEQLRKKQQIDIKFLSEVPTGREQSMGLKKRWWFLNDWVPKCLLKHVFLSNNTWMEVLFVMFALMSNGIALYHSFINIYD